jgi:anti-sigma regulatory factor (Ser/Thr protein kinase)
MKNLDDDVPHVRLPSEGGAQHHPCLLLAEGDGIESRQADRIENAQLGLADRLLGRSRDVLSTGAPNGSEVIALTAQLTDALADVLLIARSRGARLGGGTPAVPSEVPAVPLPIAAEGVLVLGSAAGLRAYGFRSFPGRDLASAPAARRYVRDTARSWGLGPGATDDLETIAGELVANALEHTGSPTVTVTCALTACSAAIGVTDEGGCTPPTAAAPVGLPGPDQERGRGLLITQALAHHCGTRRTGNGLTVWAEIPADTRRSSSGSARPIP